MNMLFYIFFGTNLLTQCQVPVPVFSRFLTPFRGDFETESKWKKILEKIFPEWNKIGKLESQGRGASRAPQAPTPRPGGRAMQACGPPGGPLT